MRQRIRTTKPEIFSDEKLWDLGVETGLPVFQGFQGLWSVADREGRFEWRPRALKPFALPFWDGDFELVMLALASRMFIVRYTVNGKDYGLVRNFKKHQAIPHREIASELPPPEMHATDDTATTVLQPGSDQAACPILPGGKGREGNMEGKGTEGSRAHAPVAAPMPEPPPGAGIRPTPLYRFPKDWKPDRQRHGDEAKWLRLSEKDIRDRAFHCKNKLYEHPFADPDDQFSRELNWCAKDKELQRSREQRKANPHGLDEKPGAKRRPGDKPSGTVFGG